MIHPNFQFFILVFLRNEKLDEHVENIVLQFFMTQQAHSSKVKFNFYIQFWGLITQ